VFLSSEERKEGRKRETKDMGREKEEEECL
jgi:hypothetical protein